MEAARVEEKIKEQEEWRIIKEFPDYKINKIGVIISFRRGKGKVLKQRRDARGYFYVTLCSNIYQKNKRIHILIYESFIGKLKINECIHHMDHNKQNNNINNLLKINKLYHSSYNNKVREVTIEKRDILSNLYKGEINPCNK